MKPCTQCQKVKPLPEYHKQSRSPDGYRAACKECRKVESKASQPAQNRRRRERYHNEPGYRKRVNEYHKRFNPKANQRERKKIAEFSDSYVVKALIRNTNLKAEDIKPHPELIEAQRAHMKLNRFFKNGTKC